MTWIFLSPAAGQDDVELALLLLGRRLRPPPPAAGAAAATATGAAAVTPKRSSNSFKQLAELEDGQLGDAVEDLFLGQGACHRDCSLVLVGSRQFGRRSCRWSARRLRPASLRGLAAGRRRRHRRRQRPPFRRSARLRRLARFGSRRRLGSGASARLGADLAGLALARSAPRGRRPGSAGRAWMRPASCWSGAASAPANCASRTSRERQVGQRERSPRRPRAARPRRARP